MKCSFIDPAKGQNLHTVPCPNEAVAEIVDSWEKSWKAYACEEHSPPKRPVALRGAQSYHELA